MKLNLIIVFFILNIISGYGQINIRLGGGSGAPSVSVPNTANGYYNGYGNFGSILDTVRGAIVVTTNDTSGSSNYNAATGVLNIPTYSTTSGTITEADYYVSAYGSDGNSGTGKTAPKRTISALTTLTNASTIPVTRIALEGGSVFRSEGITLTRGSVSINSYNRNRAGKYHFPLLIGADPFVTGWTLTDTHWSQDIPNTFTDEMNGYDFMYVIEVDTLLEKVAPLTARHYLRRVASIAAVDTTTGSYYSALSAAVSPMAVHIHTTDGTSPNNNARYRYEVVTRNNAIYRNAGGTYGQEVNVENIFAMDYAQGQGEYGSRLDSLYVNRCIAMGNAKHIASAGNYSSYNNCGFICGDPTIMEYAFTFYRSEALNSINTMQNSFFLDLPTIMYAHASYGAGGGSYYDRINFANNYIFNTSASIIQSDVVVDTFDINYCYAKNSGTFIANCEAQLTYLRNSIMENGTALIHYSTNTVVDNSLFRSKPVFSSAIILNTHHRVSVTNSILHFKTTSSLSGTGGRMFSNSDTSTRVTAKYNIFISEVPTGSVCEFSTANNWTGLGTDKNTFDYNVYIMVSGNPMWKVSNISTNGSDPSVTSFAAWKTQSGQDAHSIFIDLRYREADLRRIFIDPDAGNYNLTSSPQADSIRTVLAGMRTPLGSWVNTPSREQVVDIIENDKFKPVSELLFSPVTSSEANKVWNGTTYTKLW